jgi:transcriptional regulator of acetoin/glycerol metabolism
MATLPAPVIANQRSWTRFQSGLCSDDEIAGSLLLQRWRRCRDVGLSADNPGEPMMALAGLAEAVDAFAPLLAPGAPFDAFATALANDGFCSVFCDHQGRVLSSRVAEPFATTVASRRLTEGAVWTEAARGTNGIGTTLAERQPVAIVGPAHYEQRNHVFACYGSPIRDVRERVVAVLDATGPADLAGPFIHASVVAAAVALEALIVGRTYDAAHPGGLFAIERLLAKLPHAAFLLETTGRIRRVNAGFRALVPEDQHRSLAGMLIDVPWNQRGAPGRLALPALGARRHLDADFEPLGQPGDPFAAIVHLRKRAHARAPLSLRRVSAAFDAIVGSDPAIVAARVQAARFADADLPVLLLGETGTGKELFARAIHRAGRRASGPFVAVSAGALTGTLLESELFGYGPGAFTGAAPGGRMGRLEAADGGTLFLDEIGEMALQVQAMLLRFLDEGRFFRVGESTERRADVRLVTATNRDLSGLVDERRFRSDLFFRLRGVVLRLPPLRDRADRSELAASLLERIARERGSRPPGLSPAARAWVEGHGWPGNVRELRTALEYAVVSAAGAPRLELWHLPVEAPAAPNNPHPLLSSVKRDALLRALENARGNMSAAARELGVARSTLYRMLVRHGLKP